jgi:hypothetical protein
MPRALSDVVAEPRNNVSGLLLAFFSPAYGSCTGTKCDM